MDHIHLQHTLPQVFAGRDTVISQVWHQDIVFDKGKRYLIEASSGTGKSSLCSYIYGYRRDYQGIISFDGRNIRSFSVGEWADVRKHSLSILFQELRIFPELTALENVLLKNRLTNHKKKCSAPFLCQQHRAAFPKFKVGRFYYAVVDKREYKAVSKTGTQFLHQIQRQRFPPRPIRVKIAHIGVQSHAFQCRSAVVGKQAVSKGQHGVKGVQRRTAAALAKEKGFLSLQDHLVQYAEIRRRANALQPPQTVRRGLRRDLRQQSLQLLGYGGKPLTIDTRSMIPPGTLHAPSGIVDLSENHIPGDAATLRGIVRHTVLHPPQQDISLHLPGHAGKELPSLRAERQSDLPLRTFSHQGR